MQQVVLDASVILKWYLDFPEEKNREKSLLILEQHLERDIEINIPEFAYYETIHVLKFSKYKLGLFTIRKAVNSLYALKLNSFPFDKNLFLKSLDISFESDLSLYDSYYVALAFNLNCPLITSDGKILNRCSSLSKVPTSFETILLDRYEEGKNDDKIPF